MMGLPIGRLPSAGMEIKGSASEPPSVRHSIRMFQVLLDLVRLPPSASCSRKAEGQDHGGGYIGKNEKVTGTLDYRIRSCSVDPQEELRIVRD